MPLRLEEPPVFGVGRDMGLEGSGEGLAKKDIAILAALALIHEDFAVFQIDVADLDATKFADADSRIECQPQHQGMLDVFRLVHHLVELAELVGVQDAGELLRFLGRLKLASLANSS